MESALTIEGKEKKPKEKKQKEKEMKSKSITEDKDMNLETNIEPGNKLLSKLDE
jgi:hypothetical protein